MSTGAPQAVLLDALGTLVDLEDPVGGLVREFGALGAPLPAADARRALRAEIAFYRAHHDEACDEAALEDLRDRCTGVLLGELGARARGVAFADARAALLAALRFTPFPEVPGVLARLREAGVPLAVVSNWDVSLHGVLRDTGLDGFFAAVLTSAEEGVAKPAPALFLRALARLGDPDPAAVVHCGDDLRADVEGARAAGLQAVLVDREGGAGVPAGVRVVRSLAGLLPGAR